MDFSTIDLTNINQIETEEATKMTLIMPFIQKLGYNVFDINEVVPEYTADIAKKKGEKIDYAIKIDGKIAFVIEAKHVAENLDNHSKQLARYFVNTDAKIAILTNGLEYRFFTDIDKDNIMDDTPFFTFNIQTCKEKDIEYLIGFSKAKFNENNLYGKAEKSRKISEMVAVIDKEFTAPSEDFIKLLIDRSYTGIKTKYVIEEYTEYITSALTKYIDNKITEKLKSAFPDVEIKPQTALLEKTKDKTKETSLSINEATIYGYVKLMIKDIDTFITYKDTLSYFNILKEGKVQKWICRVYDHKELKVTIFNQECDIEVILNDPADIFKYREELIAALANR